MPGMYYSRGSLLTSTSKEFAWLNDAPLMTVLSMSPPITKLVSSSKSSSTDGASGLR